MYIWGAVGQIATRPGSKCELWKDLSGFFLHSCFFHLASKQLCPVSNKWSFHRKLNSKYAFCSKTCLFCISPSKAMFYALGRCISLLSFPRGIPLALFRSESTQLHCSQSPSLLSILLAKLCFVFFTLLNASRTLFAQLPFLLPLLQGTRKLPCSPLSMQGLKNARHVKSIC